MTIYRVQKSEAPKEEQISDVEMRQNIAMLAKSIEHMPEYKHASPYVFGEFYKEKGIDLAAEFSKRKVTSHKEEIVHNFVTNKTKGPLSEIAETMPLLANAKGRLGDYLEASVTKTARPDDEGNSFIDLIVEIKNNWLADPAAPKEAKDLPTKMTFLVDVTTAWGESLQRKQVALMDEYLVRGKEANVLCYKDSLGTLGITRPKSIVAKSPEYIEKIGERMGGLIRQTAGDAFHITNPTKFDEEYRAFFMEFMKGIKENAMRNVEYITRLEPDAKRKVLADKYKKIIAFVEMYEKTPIKRIAQSGS